MTANPPAPIELPERVHGPVRPADVPDGWEWKYALYDPHNKGCWHTDPPSPSTYMVWVREPDADLVSRSRAVNAIKNERLRVDYERLRAAFEQHRQMSDDETASAR